MQLGQNIVFMLAQCLISTLWTPNGCWNNASWDIIKTAWSQVINSQTLKYYLVYTTYTGAVMIVCELCPSECYRIVWVFKSFIVFVDIYYSCFKHAFKPSSWVYHHMSDYNEICRPFNNIYNDNWFGGQ